MASAIRMTQRPPRSATIASTGAFGGRVSEILAAGLSGCREFSAIGSSLTDAFAAGPSTIVLVLARPDQDLCESADQLSWRRQTPWLPVVMEHPVIRVGPVICPPGGPCFRCYTLRRAQHDRQRWATASLDMAYHNDQTCGPEGYLPHHARIAAALARDMLDRLALHDRDQVVGEVTTVRLLAGGLNTGRVIARHGCDRCGAGGPSVRPDWLGRLSEQLRAEDQRDVAERSSAGRPDDTLAVR